MVVSDIALSSQMSKRVECISMVNNTTVQPPFGAVIIAETNCKCLTLHSYSIYTVTSPP